MMACSGNQKEWKPTSSAFCAMAATSIDSLLINALTPISMDPSEPLIVYSLSCMGRLWNHKMKTPPLQPYGRGATG